MKLQLLAAAALVAGLGLVPAVLPPQTTPPTMAATYSALADTILALKKTEANFVRSVVAGHFHGAQSYVKAGDGAKAAAEMALFANEGDNAMAGVRKRLLEGGHHHHHADDTAQGEYDAGFVIVTRKAKEAAMAASAAMRDAKDDAARQAAWKQFSAVAEPLLAAK